MLLFYIRHGDPIYNPDSLTPLGHRQAESVAKRLALFGIDEIYVSSSIRARETAQPTCEMLGKEAIVLDWLHESYAQKELFVELPSKKHTWIWSHPYYSRLLTSREVRKMGYRWYEHPEFAEIHPEISLDRIGKNLDELLTSLGVIHDREHGDYTIEPSASNKRIAVFAHEGVGKLLMSELLDIPFTMYAPNFDMKHTGMSVIAFDEGNDWSRNGHARARVLTLSNDSHLYRDGLPMVHESMALNERY